MSPIIIELPQPIIQKDSIRIEMLLTSDDGLEKKIFWEHIGDNLPNPAEISGDFALLAALPYLMHHGRSAHIAAPVRASFFETVEECQDLWCRWRPDIFKKITITTDQLIGETNHTAIDTKSAVMAFSGGVDACFSLYAHQSGLLGTRSKNINLGILISGFDIPLDRPDWESVSKTACSNILSEFKSPLNIVRTNWKEICIEWGMTFGMAIMSVLLQYRNKYSCGIWSADEPYETEAAISPWGNHSSQNHMFLRGHFPLFASGAGWSRSEKVGHISNSPAICENIRVCWAFPESGLNCGCCEKCVRTYLNFQIAGKKNIPAISPQLNPRQIRHVKIKHSVAQEYYKEIERMGSTALEPATMKAVKKVLFMAPFYISLKKFLDRNPRLKKTLLSRIDPRAHY